MLIILGQLKYPREIRNKAYAEFWGADKVYYGRHANGELWDHDWAKVIVFSNSAMFWGTNFGPFPCTTSNYQSMTTSCQGSFRRVFQYAAAILENAGANAAARLLMSCKKYDHITPVLINLHWLPVRYRINFKILLLTFKPSMAWHLATSLI